MDLKNKIHDNSMKDNDVFVTEPNQPFVVKTIISQHNVFIN